MPMKTVGAEKESETQRVQIIASLFRGSAVVPLEL